MWRNKLLTKTIDPENQRTTIIALNNEGRNIIEGFNKQREDRLQTFFDAINTTDDEEQVMLDVFERAIKFFDERLGMKTITNK